MATSYTGLRVQDTYNAIIKIGDNSNLTSTPKLLSDGLGNDTPLYLSGTRLGIGISPTYQFQTSGNAKIGGNLIIAGNLTVNGSTTIVDSTIVAIGDNMIEMAKDNVANTMDIGWYGTIVENGTKYVGMKYDAGSGVTTPTFELGYGTTEPSGTAEWTVKGKLVIGAIDSTGGSFSGQITIPQTPTADGHAASKKYVDDQIADVDTAKRLEVTVKNVSGAELAKGVVVHASPTATPPSGNVIEVIAADANDAAKMPSIGILNETIADQAEGEAVMFGTVQGIDTSGFSIGDELYVSETAGEFTATKPTAYTSEVQKIAVVIKSHASNGLIKVFGAGRANDVPNRIDRNVNFTDSSLLSFGNGVDFYQYHDGTNSYVKNYTGDLIIAQNANDKDIIFQSDDGSGGVTTYLFLDGSNKRMQFNTDFITGDNNKIVFGNSGDLEIYHDGTNSVINNKTGDLQIYNNADDKDIVFLSDNGSGGTATYYYLDGSEQLNRFLKNILIPDNVHLSLGNSFDLKIYHDGSNSYITDSGTGDLYIQGSDDIYITAANGEKFITCNTDGSVEIRYDNVKKFETTSTGISVTGSVTANLSAEGTYFTGGSGGVRQLSITSGTNISAHALHTFNIASSNGKYEFDIDGNTEFSLDSSNATFAGKIGLNGSTPAYTIDTGETTVGTLRMVGEDDHTFIRLGAGGGGNDVTLIRIDGESSNHDGESDLGAYGFSLKYLGSLSGNENALALYADNSAAASQVESFRVKQDGTLDMGGSSIFTQFIKSNSSFRIDIDNDNNQTDRIFIVSKHNSGTELFRVDEDGDGTFAGNINADGNIVSETTSGNHGIKVITADDAEGFLIFGDADDNSMGGMAYNNSTNSLDIDCNNGVALSFNSSRNATFAGTISSGNISVTGGGGGNGQIDVSRTSGANVRIQSQSAAGVLGVTTDHKLDIKTNDTTRISIANSGAVTFNHAIYTGGNSINMGNGNINNVNALYFNDAGGNEGINWNGGNLWKIYESPNDLSNAAGNLQFVKDSTRYMTLDTSGNLYTIGQINTKGLAFHNGEGDILDSSTAGKSGIGNTFRWVEQNSSNTGSTWKKICDVVLNQFFYDGVQMEVIVYEPTTNWGDNASLNKNYYSVAFRGDQSDTGPFYNDVVIYGKNADLLRGYKTGTYTYELQARSNVDHKDLVVEYTITSKNNAKVTPTTGYVDGTNSGGTAYTASQNANTITKFAGNIDFLGATFDDATIDDLRVEGILYLGAGADTTYGGYLTNKGAANEGISMKVHEDDGFDIYQVWGNGGEADLTFEAIDGGIKLYYSGDEKLATASDGVNITGNLNIGDDNELRLGDDNDIKLYYNSTSGNGNIENHSGHLYITNYADDSDIKFLSDNGTGGTEVYFELQGVSGGTNPFTVFPDMSHLVFGSGHDFRFYHNGTSGNSNIENYNGSIYITNYADNEDIIFRTDNGDGNVTEYFRLDGSTNTIPFGRSPHIVDNLKLYFGNDTADDASIKWDSADSQLFIDGTSKFLSSVTILGDSAAASLPLIIGSSSATNYTLQQWQTSAHGTNEAYIIAYGADHGSQAGNFAMKNIEASGEIFFELASGVEPLRMTSTSSTFAGDINANSGIVRITSDAPILRATSNNNASGFRIQVNGLDGDGDDLLRVQDVGTTRFNLKRNGDLANNWIPATDSTYDLGSTSKYWRNVYADNIYSSGVFHPLSLISKVYSTSNTSSSISGGTSLDEEYELLEFGESASPVYLNIKTAAHNSASFVITRGYFGNNTASINCTGSTYTANGGYANLRGIRVIKDNNNAYKVIVRLYRGSSHVGFNLYARAWGGTATGDIVFNTTLTDTFTESNALGGIADLSVAGSLSAAYSRDTLYVDNASSRYGNSSDLQIYHDGSNSYIKDTNASSDLIIRSNHILLQAPSGENMIFCDEDGMVRLYYNNSAKLETTSTGVTVTGNAIVSSGKIGIDVTDPLTKLHTYEATENWVYVETSGTNAVAGLRTQTSSGSRQNTLYRNVTSNLVTLRAGTDDGEIAFIAGGSANERMRIHESGCISVNSTTDEGRFLINQSGLGSTSGDEDTNLILMGSRHDLIFKQIRTANGSDWNNTTLRLQTRVDSTLMSSIDFVSDSSYARHIDINTASNTFNTRFTHGGSVGIATNNPSERLSVANGSVAINNSHSFMVGGATGDTIIGRLKNTAGVLNLEANSTRQIRFGNGSQGELMRLNCYTQKVGINITNPADKLDVYNGSYSVIIGSASFSWVGSTAYPTIYGSNQDRWVMITSPHIPYLENGVSGYTGNTAGARVRFASKSGATGVVSWDAGVTHYGGTDTFTIGRDDNALVQVNSSGYMGIGGSPSHKLHLKQNSNAHLVNLIEQDNASYEAWYEAKSQNSGYVRFGISTDANAYAFFSTSVTSYNWYHTGGGLLMTLNSNGHLGLGITNLTFAKLAVNGATYSSGGTFNAGTDTVTNAAFVLDEGDYIYTRDSSAYARKLIGKSSDIITIGQSGTSLIDGIDFYSGSGGANYRWFRNTSVAMQLYGSGSQPYEILDVKGRIKAETDNGNAVDVPRSKNIPYQGATGYYDFDPVAEFGHSKQGGYVLLEVNGWQTRFNAGYIHWNNNGGTGAIGTGSVTYRQIAWSGSASGAGVTVSTVSSSTNVIRISFSGWHSNSHGWKAAITNRY